MCTCICMMYNNITPPTHTHSTSEHGNQALPAAIRHYQRQSGITSGIKINGPLNYQFKNERIYYTCDVQSFKVQSEE